MDGPRRLTQYGDMKTATEFVSDRLEAHKAACRELEKDALVQAALEAQRKNPISRDPAPAGWYYEPGWMLKRQAD